MRITQDCMNCSTKENKPSDEMIHELIPDLIKWQQEGKPAALATVINTWGSSPRPVGSQMAVSEDGYFYGSVSGGCVESDVIAAALKIIKHGESQRLNYGVSDQSAWEVGLACGGQIEIFIHPIIWETLSPLLNAVQEDQLTWYTINLESDGNIEITEPPPSQKDYPHFTQTDQGEFFTHFYLPQPHLVIVGGVNLAQPLAKLARTLNFMVTVIDPRRAFAVEQRFPTADRIVNAWPDQALKEINLTPSTAVAILSHDDKIDLPALEVALSSPAFYVGALGSSKTQSRRKQLLIDQGMDPQLVDQIHGPIGLDLGGNQTEEIALAILAEIIAISNKKTSFNP